LGDADGITKDDVATMTKCWWDGASAEWNTDAAFDELCKTGHKITANGISYMLRSSRTFGDGDSQCMVTACKGKKGLVVAHGDFITVVGMYDDNEGKPVGPVSVQVQKVAESYKEQGY